MAKQVYYKSLTKKQGFFTISTLAVLLTTGWYYQYQGQQQDYFQDTQLKISKQLVDYQQAVNKADGILADWRNDTATEIYDRYQNYWQNNVNPMQVQLNMHLDKIAAIKPNLKESIFALQESIADNQLLLEELITGEQAYPFLAYYQTTISANTNELNGIISQFLAHVEENTPRKTALYIKRWLMDYKRNLVNADENIRDTVSRISPRINIIKNSAESLNSSADQLRNRMAYFNQRLGESADNLLQAIDQQQQAINQLILDVEQSNAPQPALIIGEDLRPMQAKLQSSIQQLNNTVKQALTQSAIESQALSDVLLRSLIILASLLSALMYVLNRRDIKRISSASMQVNFAISEAIHGRASKLDDTKYQEIKTTSALMKQILTLSKQSEEKKQQFIEISQINLSLSEQLASIHLLQQYVEQGMGLQEFSEKLLNHLLEKTESDVAVMYLVERFGKKGVRIAYSGYCADKHNEQVVLADGMIGRCIREQKIVHMQDLPKGYFTVDSGLGQAECGQLLILPIYYAGQLQAIIELGSLGQYQAEHKQAITDLQTVIASCLQNFQQRKNNATVEQPQKTKQPLKVDAKFADKNIVLVTQDKSIGQRLDGFAEKAGSSIKQVSDIDQLVSEDGSDIDLVMIDLDTCHQQREKLVAFQEKFQQINQVCLVNSKDCFKPEFQPYISKTKTFIKPLDESQLKLHLNAVLAKK